MEKDETERTGRENDCLDDENRIVITLRRPASAPSMSEILRKEQPEEMSVQEKDIICMLTDEEPPLPYPTHPLKLAYGPDARGKRVRPACCGSSPLSPCSPARRRSPADFLNFK